MVKTCAICGSELDRNRKCFRCGRIVCKNCARMEMGVYACVRCTGEKPLPASRGISFGIKEL